MSTDIEQDVDRDRGFGQEQKEGLGGSFASASSVGVTAPRGETEQHAKIRALRERRAEIQWRLETGALRAENEALESQVLQMQEVFLALQEDFREMKDRFGERLEELHKALDDQRAITTASEKRVVCSEDLVRFHEEQRRLMAGHWKGLCQMKDENIRHLNLQLTEYTRHWQQSGVQKQTEASLSHELQCLHDRHVELLACRPCKRERTQELEARVSEARTEASQLREAESEARVAAQLRQASQTQESCPMELHEAEATCSELQGQLQLLTEWERQRGDDDSPRSVENIQAMPSWPHVCIWRDELDVRERQLEKITVQLDRTNNALHVAQAALAKQRAKHEEMKTQHREAEASWRESERRRINWQREYLNLQRAESTLQKHPRVELRQDLALEWLSRSLGALKALETADGKTAESEDARASGQTLPQRGDGFGQVVAAPAGPGPRSVLGSSTSEATSPWRRPRTGVTSLPPSSGAVGLGLEKRAPPRGQMLQDRIAAIGRETHRIAELRQRGAAAAAAAAAAADSPTAAGGSSSGNVS
eukprot:CAMPEP_0115192990 /NCGR_PEP_ID=MMETSP0270-20121206/13324_1 /TAXON_ID=71861 /ORGANISM="Scrippsiella trochoidea, Strain CCMP3099" /LENGTH=537 /DNA_ID=CAMNT_0002606247 /DNA_START=50 /DNA_END=1663 /DNA_ORIENTATION=-